MIRRIFGVFILVMLYASIVFGQEEHKNKERITWLATKISGYFDSSPDPKYWQELDSFGIEAIPVVNQLIYLVGDDRRQEMIFVFSCLKGDDVAVVNGLRAFIKNKESQLDNGMTVADFRMVFRCLARKGFQEDLDVLKCYESHTNIFLSEMAKGARRKLEKRLAQEVVRAQPSVVRSIPSMILNVTSVVDKTSTTITTQEVVAPNVLPEEKGIPRKPFPYLMLVGGALLVVLGSIFVVTRKRKSGK